jgi:CRISPR system Cascade subunit CasE
MIISQFQISIQSREGRRDLSNPYEMHRTIGRLLDGSQALWRQENRQILLLSEGPPNWDLAPPQYFDSEPGSKTFPLDRFHLQDRTLRFRLQANPTKSTKEGLQKGQRGKRVQLFRQTEQVDWLRRQGERCGFQLQDVVVQEQGSLKFRKGTGTAQVTIGSCLFDGRLKVTNTTAFRLALGQGVGRAKAFGFGLLTIAPG